MGPASEALPGGPRQPPLFATTHWSVVMAAGDPESPQAAEALERLCRTYWYPIYAHIRRRGHSEHDAHDLTQGYFAQLLERESLKAVSSDKGKFRSFLLASLNYFLADAYDRASAQKRGGGTELISFDAHEAEQRLQLEPVEAQNPERIFERRWALALLDQVLRRLEQEFVASGKRTLFDRLRGFLVEGAANESLAGAGRDLQLSEEAVKKAVQRMRRRYYELFRAEVANTVASPDEVDDELRYLCALMAAN